LDLPDECRDIATGTFLGEIGTDGSSAVAFHPTEPWLHISTGTKITGHTIDVDALIELGRSRLTRDMTDEECELYLRGPCEATGQ
jgi:hypothetical protein